jgi:hypothetical protein
MPLNEMLLPEFDQNGHHPKILDRFLMTTCSKPHEKSMSWDGWRHIWLKCLVGRFRPSSSIPACTPGDRLSTDHTSSRKETELFDKNVGAARRPSPLLDEHHRSPATSRRPGHFHNARIGVLRTMVMNHKCITGRNWACISVSTTCPRSRLMARPRMSRAGRCTAFGALSANAPFTCGQIQPAVSDRPHETCHCDPECFLRRIAGVARIRFKSSVALVPLESEGVGENVIQFCLAGLLGVV